MNYQALLSLMTECYTGGTKINYLVYGQTFFKKIELAINFAIMNKLSYVIDPVDFHGEQVIIFNLRKGMDVMQFFHGLVRYTYKENIYSKKDPIKCAATSFRSYTGDSTQPIERANEAYEEFKKKYPGICPFIPLRHTLFVVSDMTLDEIIGELCEQVGSALRKYLEEEYFTIDLSKVFK